MLTSVVIAERMDMNKIKNTNILCLILVLIYIGVGLVGDDLFRPLLSDLDQVTAARISLVISQGLILIPALIYVAVTKQNLFRLIRFQKMKLVTVLLLLVFTYSILPFLSLINAVSMLFSTNVIESTIGNVVGGSLFIGLLMVALMPAIVEEVTYRGIVYHSYRSERPIRGILMSGLIFGAMHMNFNQFCYAFLLGCIMAFVLEAADSILAPMIMHFIFNGNSVFILYIVPKINSLMSDMGIETNALNIGGRITKGEMMAAMGSLVILAILGLALAFAIFLLIAHINGRFETIREWFLKGKTGKEGDKKIMDFYLGSALILCLIMAVFTEVLARISL